MKLMTLTLASAAVALLGGAAFAQPQPAAPTPASVASTTAAEPPAEPTVSATSTTEAPAAAGADVSANAASVTNITVTNGPVPDTAENRAKYGAPLSHAGKRTPPRGN